MKKQLMIALLSIVPAWVSWRKINFIRMSSRWATSPFWTDHFRMLRGQLFCFRYPKNASHFVWCEAFFRMY